MRRDGGWIGLYGREAYDRAVAATEWVLDLEYPPPADPRSSGAADPGDDELNEFPLVVQAAWGGPRLWPAHMIAAMSVVQETQLKLMHCQKGPLEQARWT